jgi:homoserine dehydrogenase
VNANPSAEVSSKDVVSPTVRLGIIGAGTVGSALITLLRERSEAITARTGITLVVTRIAVTDLSKDRPGLDRSLLVDDPWAVVGADEVDLVVELMGGIDPTRQLIAAAIANGKPVVTGNKALLAMASPELFAAADAAGVDLLFEAAVAGGIPLIRPLRESLIGEDVTRVLGIVNGTTNYILTRMTEAGASYGDALAEAQALGYAEADPTADVEGLDAAAKASIIATIAFGRTVLGRDVAAEGISSITTNDIANAAKLHHVIKLLAVAEEVHADGVTTGPRALSVRVFPAMVPASHPLASVRGSFNAVFVEGRSVGELMFYGRGAGGDPTASAVLGDVVDAAVNLRKGTHASLGTFAPAVFASPDDLSSAYYLQIEVADRPGVLAAVASAFGAHGVSIRSMEQEGLDEQARIIFITHVARERDVERCLDDLRALDAVRQIVSVLRVIGTN